VKFSVSPSGDHGTRSEAATLSEAKTATDERRQAL